MVVCLVLSSATMGCQIDTSRNLALLFFLFKLLLHKLPSVCLSFFINYEITVAIIIKIMNKSFSGHVKIYK